MKTDSPDLECNSEDATRERREEKRGPEEERGPDRGVRARARCATPYGVAHKHSWSD
jgi:hypothetical protein